MLTFSHEQQLLPSMPPRRLRDTKSGTTLSDREGDTFIPIAIERYGAILSQMDRILRDCARRAFSKHGGSFPSSSVLVTWFRQRIAVTLQRAHARAIHAHMAHHGATSSLLFSLPTRVVISTRDLTAIVGSSQNFVRWLFSW